MNITLNNLEIVTRLINIAVGNTTPDAIGHYKIEHTFGGWQLVKVITDAGNIYVVTPSHVSKRALYGKLLSFLAGIDAEKNKESIKGRMK